MPVMIYLIMLCLSAIMGRFLIKPVVLEIDFIFIYNNCRKMNHFIDKIENMDFKISHFNFKKKTD